MPIDIDHVAKLARLGLTDEEKTMLAEQLPLILDYVGKLKEVDTKGIDVKAYLTDATNVFGDDVPQCDEAERKAVIDDFPKKQGDALEVPGVFV